MQDLQKNLNGFSSITLTELNATASFLKRIDRKFLTNLESLNLILKDLSKDFHILEISDKRIFSYDNIYMDTEDYLFFNQHQNKESSRAKVRTRLYVESNIAFFEYKHKESGILKKFRYEFPASEHGTMTKGKKRFFQGVFESLNGKKAPVISPSIKTKYNRLTLVSKSGQERLTIDFNINVSDLRNKNNKSYTLENLVIIESKSMDESCLSLKILASHGLKKAKSCSKYSLGVIYSGLVERYDTFKETVEKIKEIRLETVKHRSRKGSIKRVSKSIKHNFNKKEL